MNFHNGDSVMHWTHGLGKVVRLEAMTLSGENILYYAIQIGDMTVWVPADDKLETRLRIPTDAAEFKKLMEILSHPGEPLESTCKVMYDELILVCSSERLPLRYFERRETWIWNNLRRPLLTRSMTAVIATRPKT